MGNPTASCLKIITCGSDSAGHDDIGASQTNGSNDQRRWSFRKRSARHKVLSSIPISESVPSANKAEADSASVNSQGQPNLIVSEKTSATPSTEEKAKLSSFLNLKLPDSTVTSEDDPRAVATIDEPRIIVIQAAMRSCLARRMLTKQKSIIKLQAIVRGQLIRRRAVGTLRCILAIVKMQALVRAHQARLPGRRTCDFEKRENSEKKCAGEAELNVVHTYISLETLLSNSFTRQLIELTPMTKSINIKCESSKSDSSWNWLERWMSVSAVGIKDPLESESEAKQLEENVGHSSSRGDIAIPSVCTSEPGNIKLCVGSPAKAFENDDSYIAYDADEVNLQLCEDVSLSSSSPELLTIDTLDSINAKEGLVQTKITETGLKIEVESGSHLEEKTGSEYDTSDRDKISVENPEIGAITLSRESSSPAFIATRSNFEDLTSDSTSAKLEAPPYNESGVESNLDTFSLSIDHPFRVSEIGLADNSSAAHVVGSECGTELSITSTLDSPDRSEVDFNDLDLEPHPINREDLGLEANGESSIAFSNHLDRVDSAPNECVSSVISVHSPELENKPKAVPQDLQLELASEPSQLVQKTSPEASPRSSVTVPESQETPSSLVTMTQKHRRGEKNESNQKIRSSLADKTSGPKANNNSPSRNVLEPLQKDFKIVKRRNSFSSSKPDHAGHEPRVSSGSNSLPSYMQATESAKAKSIVNSSPRSSPDVRDKDTYTKMRDSLPGTNGTQGSPRAQRTLSQAKMKAKGNDSHSPQDRKWRR